MKFNRLIITGILCCVTIGTYAWVSQTDHTAIHQNLTFKEISGTREALEDIQAENVIQIGAHQYEKVIFSKDGVDYTPTQFDEGYGVGEDVLAHKDLFRGHTSGAYIDTSDNKIVLAEWNPKYPYASHEPTVELRIKDEKTGQIMTESRNLTEVEPNQYWMKQQLFEIGGKIIYVLQLDGEERKNLIYEVNPKNLTLKLLLELSPNRQEGYPSSFVSDGQLLYTIMLVDQGTELMEINVQTGKITRQEIQLQKEKADSSEVPSAVETQEASDLEYSADRFASIMPENFILNDKFMIASYRYDSHAKYVVFDRKTLKQKNGFNLSIDGINVDYGYSLIDWKLTNDKFYFIEQRYAGQMGQTFQVGVYHLKKQKLELEGQLPSQPIGNYKWTEKI